MGDFDAVRDRLRPRTKTIGIPTDDDLAEDYRAAETALAEAKQRAQAFPDDEQLVQRVDAAEDAFEEARDALDPHLLKFTFRALGGDLFEELVDAHPPTKDQVRQFRKRNPGAGSPQFNSDTFPIALLAKSCVDPAMTEADAKELWTSDSLGEGDRNALLIGALQVNQSRSAVDLGKGSKPTRH